ncbi:hypothetical protein M1M87_01820 [Thermodesulfovibrionales bacterium]|nr:hypothetical protein [Thermodesulfovibrionales bacterium]
MPKDRQAAFVFRVQRPAKGVKQRFLGLVRLDAFQVLPFPGLGFPDERDHIANEQATFRVELVPVAFFISVGRCKVVFYDGFECLFRIRFHGLVFSGLVGAKDFSPLRLCVHIVTKYTPACE